MSEISYAQVRVQKRNDWNVVCKHLNKCLYEISKLVGVSLLTKEEQAGSVNMFHLNILSLPSRLLYPSHCSRPLTRTGSQQCPNKEILETNNKMEFKKIKYVISKKITFKRKNSMLGKHTLRGMKLKHNIA